VITNLDYDNYFIIIVIIIIIITVTDSINALPGNAAVNMHPQQWETVFLVGSVQRSYLKNEWRYGFSSEFR
jgi:hypothetical protein